MALSHITVLGGDLRQAYASEYLASCGHQITCFGTPDFPYDSNIQVSDSLSQTLENASILLMPTPFSSDGKNLFQKKQTSSPLSLEELFRLIPEHTVIFYNGMSTLFQERLEALGCILHSLSDCPEFSKENATLTAEGLLSEVIRYTPFSLQNTVTLLLGYGRCGNAIGTLFSTLDTRIYVLEKDVAKQMQAEENGLLALSASEKKTILPHCDYIINTIPENVLTEEELKLLPGNCHIFDIASAPFGFSSDITYGYSLPYFRLPGLPGKSSPKTAGIVIGKTIERMIHHDL